MGEEEQMKQTTSTSLANLHPQFGQEVASWSTAPASSRQHLTLGRHVTTTSIGGSNIFESSHCIRYEDTYHESTALIWWFLSLPSLSREFLFDL